MQLLIVRHGQPERSAADGLPADPELTSGGHAQAQALGRWLTRDPGRGPDRIWSSPMRRARQTADHLAQACDLGVTVDERLAEFDLGAAHYVPIEQVGADVVEQAMRALQTGQWGDHRFDPDTFRRRVRSAFDDLVAEAARYSMRRVVVVCHGGVINSYLSGVLGRSHGMFFRPRYTSLSRVAIDRHGVPHVVSLNEFPHWATASARPDTDFPVAAGRSRPSSG